MSVKITHAVLQDFLTNDKNDVLALTGSWGSGKTHAWRAAVLAHQNKIKFKQYCYVSLFGINSMTELRMALFLKSTNVSLIGKDGSFQTINESWSPLAGEWIKRQVHRLKPLLGSLPYGSSVSLALETLAPSAVGNTLICFDDFERQTNIKPEDILGLITELREERGCKIALIFNDEALVDKETYRAYKEKAIDMEVHYAPTPKEAFELVFDPSHPYRDEVLAHVENLGITNVRILRRIRDIVSKIAAATTGMHSNVLKNSIGSTVLLCWCAFSSDPGRPDLKEIQTWNQKLWGLDKKEGEEDVDWVKRLKTYGFRSVEDIDLAISRVVQCGYVDGSGLAEVMTRLDDEWKSQDKTAEFKEIWDRFHGTFSDDSDDFVTQLYERTSDAIANIGVGDLNSAVHLLRQLKKGDLADKLIKAFIAAHQDQPNIFDLADHPFGGTVDDSTLRSEFEAVHSANRNLPSLRESISFIVEHRSHNNDHIEAMKAASVEEYFDLFNQITGHHLPQSIKACLRFTNEHAQIASKAREALTRIKASNLLNEIRVAKFGV